MRKHSLTEKIRMAAAALLIFSLAAGTAACGSKDAGGSTPGGGSGNAGNVSSGSSGNASGTGGSGSSGSGSDTVGQAAQDFASQYGIDMPDGIVSLADPDAVYEAGNVIQMSGSELYIQAKEASDWIDSATGLSDGLKYIFVDLMLTDFDAGTVKEIPAPEHYYLVEAKDEYGNPVDLNAAGASGGMLRPVTDMPLSEFLEAADAYYRASEPYTGGETNRRLLYKVPEETREIVLACWLTDQFSQPHNAAFRLMVEEKHESHTFEHMDGDEIRKLLDTSERPDLEDFGWYTGPAMFNQRAAGDYRDPEYDAREYMGGWKCYIFRDARAAGRGFEAHLANLYVENYQPEDEYEKGWVDIRIDWYLGIDEDGNVTDESVLPDTVCTHEEFYYNRMENDDGTYPFATFSFDYAQDAATGRGRYVNENKEEYTMALVRADGKKIWVLEGSRPPMTMMPGTEDVPVPTDLMPAGTASAMNGKSDTQSVSPVQSGGSTAQTVPQAQSGGGTDQTVPPVQSGSGTDQSASPSSGGSASITPGLDDFSWYFNDEFPTDGRPLTELQDLGGKWKGILDVVTPVNGEDQCRIMVCNAEVQYVGYKVTLLLNPTETHEFMLSDPGNITTEKLSTTGNIVLNGDWDDDPGYMDVTSETSAMNLVIYDFVEAGSVQYALGVVYNGETEIGEVALVRP